MLFDRNHLDQQSSPPKKRVGRPGKEQKTAVLNALQEAQSLGEFSYPNAPHIPSRTATSKACRRIAREHKVSPQYVNYLRLRKLERLANSVSVGQKRTAWRGSNPVSLSVAEERLAKLLEYVMACGGVDNAKAYLDILGQLTK